MCARKPTRIRPAASYPARMRRFSRSISDGYDPLYAALSDEQKKTADQLLVGPMGIMGMGMM